MLIGNHSRANRSKSATAGEDRLTRRVEPAAHARGAADRAVAAPKQARRSDMMCDKNTDADKCVGRPQVSTAHKSYIHVNKLLAHKS